MSELVVEYNCCRSVLVTRMETVLHDEFGGNDYWAVSSETTNFVDNFILWYDFLHFVHATLYGCYFRCTCISPCK